MRVIRSFLALKLGLDTVERLTEVQKRLRKSADEVDAVVRWVPPPNIHLTLRFLGQITEPMSHAVKDMLDPIISKNETFELETKGLGVFPDEAHPKVIWAGLGEGVDTLTALYDSIYKRLLTAGFNFEDKPFTPHITLGRVKHSAPDALAALLKDDEATSFGLSTIRHFYCYQSDLTPQGAEYTAQWVLPFKRKPVQRQPLGAAKIVSTQEAAEIPLTDDAPLDASTHPPEESSETPNTGE